MITKRSMGALLAGASAVAMNSVSNAWADVLPAPTVRPILAISGMIAVRNFGDEARFDRPMLEALGTTSFKATTPWFEGAVEFEGVPMTRLLHAVGASGDKITAVALNDYTTEIPVSDFDRFGVILALKRNGEYMSIRDKGPLFIIYPYDSQPELQNRRYYARSAWQVARLIVG